MKAWLLLYNLASAAGWAYIVYITATSFLNGLSPAQLWEEVGDALIWVQTAAVLEILHCLLRWVRSPLMTTVMQVGGCARHQRRRGVSLALPSHLTHCGGGGCAGELSSASGLGLQHAVH